MLRQKLFKIIKKNYQLAYVYCTNHYKFIVNFYFILHLNEVWKNEKRQV
jgi:pyruvate formate-lyase activating enzyme-like uncharacterized protein